jgi:hypothetical protein
MGKSVNVIGTIRGKVGSMVFSKGPDGSTIMRAYQPQVANPRTSAQLAQRAKVVMAGKLSKLIPIEALSGLGMGSRLANRSWFNSHILREAVAVLQQGTYTASVPPSKIVFSSGPAVMGATIGTVTLAASQVNVAISNPNGDGLHGGRFIAVVMQNVAGDAYRMASFTDAVFTSATSTVAINLPQALNEGDWVLVYACPFVINTSARRGKSAGVWFETAVNGQLVVPDSGIAEFGNSQFYLTQPYSA